MKHTIHVTKNSCVCIGIVLAFIVLLAGCSGGSPESVTREFLKAVEKNDLKALSEISTEGAFKELSSLGDRLPDMMAGKKVKTMTETINGDKAVVKVIYENGDDEDMNLIKVDGKWKVGYAARFDSIGNMLGRLMSGSADGTGNSVIGSHKAPSARDIDMGSDASHSKAEIMAVVNARMPGLRRTYNQYLKTNSGLAGKVTLKFTIASGGDITSISIVSSTTGNSEFDNAIKDAVATWKWKAIQSGTTTPTIPFTFEGE